MQFLQGPIYDTPMANAQSERERILKLRQQGAFANKPQSPVVGQEGASYFAPPESFISDGAFGAKESGGLLSSIGGALGMAIAGPIGGLLGKKMAGKQEESGMEIPVPQTQQFQLQQPQQMGGRYQRRFKGLIG